MKNLSSTLLFLCVLFFFCLLLPEIKGDTISPDSGIKLQKGADYQIVKEYKYSDFKIIQLNLARLSHFSYMLLSKGSCMLVDPGRDATIYQQIAKKEKAQIKAVFLTHSHADFVAGHLETVARTGCPIYVNKANHALYKHVGVKDGDTLKIGKALVKFIETPGHTPDGMCAIIYDAGKPLKAKVIFTGDTLFVGSVGRPDLLEGQVSAVELASKMYDSWFKKLALLDDDIVVLPAHGAGSLCGSNLGKSPSSTIGEEKKTNPYLQYKSKNKFIAAILNSLGHAPQYFIHNATLNRKGPEIIEWEKLPGKELSVKNINERDSNTYIVDVRPEEEYALGHIENSINIPNSGKLATWVGIVIPWEARLIITGSGKEIAEAAHRLQRIGYKPEYISFEQWQKAGKKISKTELVPAKKLYSQFSQGNSPMILDVRQKSEWEIARIDGVINMQLQTLQNTKAKLNPSEPIVTVCRTGYRAGIAAGLLARSGFKDVKVLKGGMDAWEKAGLATTGSEPVCSVVLKDDNIAPGNLPELINSDGLSRLIKDQPDFIEIVDIRPAEQFADYNIPSSRNIELKDLLRKGAGSQKKLLILVDRDGTMSMIAAGILSTKLQRRIKVLEGGVEKYWRKTFNTKASVKPVKSVQPEKTAEPPKVKKNIIQDAGC